LQPLLMTGLTPSLEQRCFPIHSSILYILSQTSIYFLFLIFLLLGPPLQFSAKKWFTLYVSKDFLEYDEMKLFLMKSCNNIWTCQIQTVLCIIGSPCFTRFSLHNLKWNPRKNRVSTSVSLVLITWK
jgi:hypothetical protein